LAPVFSFARLFLGLRFMMWFAKGHITIFLVLMLLSAFSTVALAEDVDCITYTDSLPDGRCQYGRIWATHVGQLFVVAPGDSLLKKNALRDQEFLVYLPRKTGDSVQFKLLKDSSKVENFSPVVSSHDSGLVNLMVTGRYEIYHVPVGTAQSSEDKDPKVMLYYNFYAPTLEYSVKGEVVTNASELKYEVGDTVEVSVRAVIPIGPQTGRTDEGLSRTFYFQTSGQSDNLVFLDGEKDSVLKVSAGIVPINMKGGKASFRVVATAAVTDGSTFEMGSFPRNTDEKGRPDFKKGPDFIVDEAFPGQLKFVNPDMPSLDGAAIYDTDGDGIGDSIATWFSGNMDSVSVDTFYYSWPDSSSYKKYSGDVKESSSGDIFGLPDVSVKVQQDSATGAVKAYVCSSVGNRCETLKADLKDSIGAAIQAASLVKGDGDTDTLEVRFNKDMDDSWNEGQGLMINGKAIDAKAIKKNGRAWYFVVDAGEVSAGDKIKIATTTCNDKSCPDGVLTAADGVPTASNNKEAVVSNSGRLYLSNENNGFYDRDGDGRMDSISVGFLMPVSENALKNTELKFYWLDEDGDLVEIIPNLKDLEISSDGLVVGFALDPDKYNIKSMLTAIDKSYSKDGETEYGYAKMTNKVTVGDKETSEESGVSMDDRMPPVISTTFLYPESFQEMEPDRFSVTFSEAMDYKNLNLTDDCLQFYVDGNWVQYELDDAVWSEDGRTVTFMMEAGENLAGRMNPADSVRFGNIGAGFKDKQGNYAGVYGSDDVSTAVMVKGDPRVILQTTSMADLSRAEELNTKDTAFTLAHLEGELSEEQQKSLGILMDVGFSTIMKDSAGVSKVDPSQIGLKWELYVYTNLGAYVGSASDKMDCNDPYFKVNGKGNCLENPDKLYLRWNMRADNGRKVGVGLYLAKFVIRVYGAEEDFKVERVFRWGVTAKRH